MNFSEITQGILFISPSLIFVRLYHHHHHPTFLITTQIHSLQCQKWISRTPLKS